MVSRLCVTVAGVAGYDDEEDNVIVLVEVLVKLWVSGGAGGLGRDHSDRADESVDEVLMTC